MLQYGPILAALNTTKTNTRIRIFHTRIKLRYFNHSRVSRFVQYPHYPIACCLPQRSTVAHNCHGKSVNLKAKRNRLTAKRKRLKAKREPNGKEKKTHGKISSMPRGHFNSYFFYREVVVILFAVRLFFLPWVFFFLPWGFSFFPWG